MLTKEALSITPPLRHSILLDPGAHGVTRLTYLSPLTDSHSRVALDDPFCNRVSRETRDIMNVQLIHHLLPVFFHRLNTDTQFRGDLLVRAAFGDELQNFRFPCCQVIGSFASRLSAGKCLATLISKA